MANSKPASVVVGIVVALAAAVGVYVALTLDVRGPETPPTSDMDALKPIDPALFHYEEETAGIATGLSDARAVAVGPADRVHVAGDRAVRIFEPDGTPRSTIETADEPRCLAVAADGTLYVASANRIAVYGADGAERARWPAAAEDAIFTSVAVTPDAVFVADAQAKVVHRYDLAGKPLGEVGRKDPDRNIDGFVLPSAYLDVAVGADGMLRVGNPGRLRVERYTLDGEPLGHWGAAGGDVGRFQGCCNPVHLAVLPDGGVVTTEKGVPRVTVFAKDGTLRSVVAGPQSFLALRCPTDDCTKGKALDVAVDGRGRVLVLDPSTNTVRIFVKKEGTDR